jgi:hypothetical protein
MCSACDHVFADQSFAHRGDKMLISVGVRAAVSTVVDSTEIPVSVPAVVLPVIVLAPALLLILSPLFVTTLVSNMLHMRM